MYTATEIQSILINNTTNIQKLAFLQRNSLTKLQQVSQNGRIYIKSIHDNYHIFRMIIFSIFLKIYTSYNKNNQQRLKAIKHLIYSTKLNQLTQSKGLSDQQLFKNIAVHLNKIKTGLDCQHAIIALFNSVSFFDAVIMKVIANNFQLNHLENNLQYVQRWLKQKMNLTVIWTQQHPSSQGIDQLYLKKKNDYICRYSYQQIEQVDQYSDQSSSHRPSALAINKGKLLRTVSVDSKSPSVHRSSQLKQNKNLNKKLQFDDSHELKRYKKRGLWDILCCSFD